eukprot:4824949-Alexandrium_andersonii.AAC.1
MAMVWFSLPWRCCQPGLGINRCTHAHAAFSPSPTAGALHPGQAAHWGMRGLSLIHISEPTRLALI